MPDTRNVAAEPEGNLSETIERLLGILTRRRWWILTAGCCIPIAVVAFAMKLPDVFVSQATLLVVQQQVSQRYVESDSTTTIPAAVEALKLEVLSRERLLGIINDLGLYQDTKNRVPELLVDRMRKEIEIEPLETIPGGNGFNAFTIAFTAANPQLAQQVTSRLTSLFIEQNLKTRGEQAANTTKFLSDQLDAAKQRLEEEEQRLQTFKTNNLGELPEQQQANLEGLAEIRGRLETVTANISQIQQQKVSLELSLNDRLARLQMQKNALLARYTPKYPEVVKKEAEIAKVQAALNDLNAGAPRSVNGQDEVFSDDPDVALILRQAEANAAQMETLSQQQQKLKAQSEEYQKRLNLTPLREQQLAEIVRDYNLYKEDYTNLLNKKLQSQMTTSLEENQEGQQFRLVDPPSLPLKPSGPKRLKISLGGMAAGIFAGLVLAFLIDILDSSFHSETALSHSFSLPFVIGLPLARTPAERRIRGWRIAFEWLAGVLMTLTMLAAEFYVFQNR